MIHRGAHSRVARTLSLALVLGSAVVSAPVRGADKPPASTPVWSTEAKYDLLRTLVGADGKVVYSRDGKKMTGLNAADGSLKWQRELPGFEEKGFWGQLEDTTYVYCTSKEVVGIDVESGKDRWRMSPGEGIKTDSWIFPHRGNPKAMLLAFNNGVSVWDVAPGKLLWSAKEPLDEDLVPNAWGDEANPEAGILMFLPKRTVLVGASGKELWSAADVGNQKRGGKEVNQSAILSSDRLLLVYLSKQVVLLNNVTGEVLASQTFPSPQAAADVEWFKVDGADSAAPVLVTLGGRLVIADAKAGKVLAKTPESSILGQAAGGIKGDGTEILAMTVVRGGDKAPDVGAHLYRIDPGTGEVKWHAYNGQILDNRQVMGNIVGERINGPYYLPKAKGVLLVTSDKGVRLYEWQDGKERWALDENLPNSYRVMWVTGNNSFAVIRSMMQNRVYVPTNPPPIEGEGVIYVAGSDQVFAVDATTGKPKWTSKSKSLSLVSGLEASGSTVIVRQGLYADSNDYGAPTILVTRFLGPTTTEEPEVYIEEDPYGYVGLDAATGKESWNCLDFEAHDRAIEGPMPKDASVCEIAKAKKCKLSKLGIGGILSSLSLSNGALYLGKSGMAGVSGAQCTPTWSVDGAARKMEKLYANESFGEEKAFGYIIRDDPSYLVVHYGNQVYAVDLANGKVVVSAGKADSVHVVFSRKLLFAADGNNLALYKLP